MTTEKNITMKQFNGTDYDTLYPKTIASQIPDVYSKTETLTADTLSKYGLTSDKLPNDVFQQIKTLIDNVQASADGKARIQTGSYVGTGTYGASNPCSLTFDFVPKILIINGQGKTNVGVYNTSISIVRNINSMYIFGNNSQHLFYFTNIIWNNNSISWYSNDSSYAQANNSNTTYYWAAIT